jgi:hypothetical protein
MFMNRYHQIPDYISTLSRMASASGWLLVLALLRAIGFVVVRYVTELFRGRCRAPLPTRPALSLLMAQAEDVLQHLKDATVAQAKTVAALITCHAASVLRRCSAWLLILYPSVERAGMKSLACVSRTTQQFRLKQLPYWGGQ